MKWFVFYKGQLLLQQQDDALQVPEGHEPPVPVPDGHQVHEVTMNDGMKVKTYELEVLPQFSILNSQFLKQRVPKILASIWAIRDRIGLSQFSILNSQFSILNLN